MKTPIRCRLRMCELIIVYEGKVEVDKGGADKVIKIKGDWEVKQCLECGRQIAVRK